MKYSKHKKIEWWKIDDDNNRVFVSKICFVFPALIRFIWNLWHSHTTHKFHQLEKLIRMWGSQQHNWWFLRDLFSRWHFYMRSLEYFVLSSGLKGMNKHDVNVNSFRLSFPSLKVNENTNESPADDSRWKSISLFGLSGKRKSSGKWGFRSLGR